MRRRREQSAEPACADACDSSLPRQPLRDELRIRRSRCPGGGIGQDQAGKGRTAQPTHTRETWPGCGRGSRTATSVWRGWPSTRKGVSQQAFRFCKGKGWERGSLRVPTGCRLFAISYSLFVANSECAGRWPALNRIGNLGCHAALPPLTNSE